MLGASALLYLLTLDGDIARAEAVLLFGLVIVYTVFLIAQSRRVQRATREEYAHEFGRPAAAGTGTGRAARPDPGGLALLVLAPACWSTPP